MNRHRDGVKVDEQNKGEPAVKQGFSSRRLCFINWAAVSIVVCLGAWLRFRGLRDLGIADLLSDEARIAFGAATISKGKFFLFNYLSYHEPPLSLYYPIPFMKLFGPEVWVIKLAPVVFGVLALVFIYLFGRELFSHNTGLLAAGVAAVLPMNICYSRVLIEHSFLPLFIAASLYCHAKYLNDTKPRYLNWEALLLGLALSTKVIVLYYLAALALAILISGQFPIFHKNWRHMAVALPFFLVGAAPLLFYIWISPVFLNFIKETQNGLEPLSPAFILQAVKTRWFMLENSFSLAIRFAPVIWVVYFIAREKVEKTERKILFIPALLAVFLIISIFTVSGMFDYHFLVIVPVAAILIGSVCEIPLRHAPHAGSTMTVLIIAVISYFAFSSISHPFTTAGYEMNRRVERDFMAMNPSETIVSQRDISMLHRYAWFINKGVLPAFEDQRIISTRCNRFRQCPIKTTFLDMDEQFRAFLMNKYHKRLPWDFYMNDPITRSKEFRGDVRRFLETVLENRKVKNIFICSGRSKNHPMFYMGRFFNQGLADLHQERLIQIRSMPFQTNNFLCSVFFVNRE